MMIDNKDMTTVSSIEPVKALHADDIVEVGKWYLLETSKEDLYCITNGMGYSETANEIYKDDGQLLVCVHSFQSNLVIVKSNQRTFRVLNKNLGRALSDIDQDLVMGLIQKNGLAKQALIGEAQKEIKKIIGRIHNSGASESDSTELMVVSDNALIEQKRMLKEVHGAAIESLNNEITMHVAAISDITRYYSLPNTSGIADHTKITNVINDKLYELDLYGGMSEKEKIVATGAVASEKDPIYIFQDLKHMDVECLLGYETGGITINNLYVFDRWLAVPKNRDRILPKSRSIVAIKVRKYREHRMFGIASENNDTFLYLRNGDNIKRIETSLKVGDRLLATENNVNSRHYVKKIGSYADVSRNFAFLSEHEYTHLSEQSEKLKGLFLDTLLDIHRERHRFLVNLKDYAKLRYEKLGNGRIKDRLAKVILLEDGASLRYSNKNEEEFDVQMKAHQEIISSAVEDIDTIKNSIRNKLSYVGFGYKGASRHAFFDINAYEVGFIDNDGVEHKIEQNRNQLEGFIKETSDRYYKMGLYFPNAHKDGFTRVKEEPTPFKIQDELTKYHPMNEDHYYFDELKDLSWRQYMRQNDLAILIQGLIDRTGFFGYTEANLFSESYSDYIELVYDKDKGLYNGDMPDFKAFISKCNEGSVAGDIFYGHERLWDDVQELKAERMQCYDMISIPKFLEADKVTKKRDGTVMVKFRWETERSYWSSAKSDKKVNTFECDIKNLINVSNYKLGDCKPFVEDLRCRDKYPEWGDKILSAQKYHYSKSKSYLKKV